MNKIGKSMARELGGALAVVIVLTILFGGAWLTWKLTTNVRVRVFGGTMTVYVEPGEEVVGSTWKSGWLWSNVWYTVRTKDGKIEMREDAWFWPGKVVFDEKK